MILNLQQREKSKNLYSLNSNFGAYLHISNDDLFVLDLSQSTVLEVLEELIKMKQKVTPKYGKTLSCLIRHLKMVEEQFGCILKPIQITDVFWHHFTYHLQSKGLSISSIKTLCSQLKSALSWASKHQSIISPSYDLIQLPDYKNQQIALTPDDVSRIFHYEDKALTIFQIATMPTTQKIAVDTQLRIPTSTGNSIIIHPKPLHKHPNQM